MFFDQELNSIVPNCKRNGRWASDEHARFIKALQLFGKDWRKVEKYIGTRSGAQIRSHAQKHYLKLENKLAAGKEEMPPEVEAAVNNNPFSMTGNFDNYLKYLESVHFRAYLRTMNEIHRAFANQMKPTVASNLNSFYQQSSLAHSKSLSDLVEMPKPILQPIPTKIPRSNVSFRPVITDEPIKKLKVD